MTPQGVRVRLPMGPKVVAIKKKILLVRYRIRLLCQKRNTNE